MAQKVILSKTLEAYTSGKYSDYLLLDGTVKELLSRDLKQPFDSAKHEIQLEIRENSKNQIFGAFWFRPRSAYPIARLK